MTGKTKQAISGYLNGKTPIGKEMILFFSELLNVRICEFFVEENLAASPYLVADQKVAYSIPDNCPADSICQQVCIHCMSQPPDDKKAALLLFEILRSGHESTKTAIRQNIHEFHKLITSSDHEIDFKTLKTKRKGGK